MNSVLKMFVYMNDKKPNSKKARYLNQKIITHMTQKNNNSDTN